eukprot:349655-Chlamydomonas_euryale.AAC.10
MSGTPAMCRTHACHCRTHGTRRADSAEGPCHYRLADPEKSIGWAAMRIPSCSLCQLHTL